MKILTITTLTTLFALANTDNGLAKIICWGLLFIEFLAWVSFWEKRYE